MAGQKQNINIPFVGGLDSKTHPYLVRDGYLVLQNAITNREGVVLKRPGIGTHFTMSDVDGNAITNVRKVWTYGDELVLLDGEDMYSYISGLDRWKKIGVCPLMRVTERVELGDEAVSPIGVPEDTYRGAAYSNGFIVYTTRDTYTIVEEATGLVIQRDQSIPNVNTTTYVVPRCISLGDTHVVIVYPHTTAGRISGLYIDTTDPQFGTTETLLANDAEAVVGVRFFDAINYSAARGILAYRDNGVTAAVKIKFIGVAGIEGPNDASGVNPGDHLALAVDSSGTSVEIYTFHMDNTNTDVECTSFTWDTGGDTIAASGNVTVEAGPGQVDAIVACEAAGSTNTATCYYEIYGGAASDPHLTNIRHATVNRTPAVATAAAEFVRGVGVHGRPFKQGTKVYLPVAYETWARAATILNPDPILNSGYLLDENAAVVARFLNNTLGYRTQGQYTVDDSGVVNNASVQWKDTFEISSGKWAMGAMRIGPDVREDDSKNQQYNAQQLTKITFDFNKGGEAVEFNKNLLVSAGVLWAYDGRVACEMNFGWVPSPITWAIASSGSGQLTTGNYLIVCVYRFLDAQGNEKFSAVSPPVTAEVTVPDSPANLTVNVPTLRLSALDDTEIDRVLIQVYRTQTDGSVYYAEEVAVNSETVDSVAVTCASADATLANGAAIYSAGNVLEDDPPGPTGALAASATRVFAVGDDNVIQYSKLRQEERVSGFSSAFRELLPLTGGELTNVGVLGGNLIGFKERAIYRIYGEGPNDIGVGTYSAPEPISEEVGCRPDTPLLRVDEGYIFHSHKGLWLLDMGLKLSYIGAGVEAFCSPAGTDTDVVAAARSEEEDLALLCLNETGEMLSHDTLTRKWGLWRIQDATIKVGNVVRWDGEWIISDTQRGEVYKTGNTFLDDGTAYTLRVQTPWMRLGELDGFQRFKELHIMGRWKSPHTLRAIIDYNFDTALRQAVDFDLSTGYSANDPILLRVKPSLQKCRSISVTISDRLHAGTRESCELVGITLVAAGKRKITGFDSSK